MTHNTSYGVTPGQTLSVTVGAGGAGSAGGGYSGGGVGSNGGNSVFDSLTAIGGGGGGAFAIAGGNNGGSGGGGTYPTTTAYSLGGSGTSSQGNSGATGTASSAGGGGGYNAAGSGANGGAGLTYGGVTYGSGGGGGKGGGSGGSGAGNGASTMSGQGSDATANRGGGGGGGSDYAGLGGNGGSGIIIITWVDNPPTISSSTTAAGRVGVPFSYTITATNVPTSFGASGLPSGLSLNTSTGVVSGTVATTGIYSISLSATNDVGTGNATLTLAIQQTASTTFTSSGTWTVPTAVTSVEVLVVGGGGGGGANWGGGGGGGGVTHNTSYGVTPGQTLSVTVGAGGLGSAGGGYSGGGVGADGSNSSFDSLTAIGGGGGGAFAIAGGDNGGSGGGGTYPTTTAYSLGGSGTSGQGNAGATGTVSSAGGGGGYTAAGSGANGGAGLTYGGVTYGSGGGGGKGGGSGGSGAGNGASAMSAQGSDATANRGGGGGGGSDYAGLGGNGGSGIVIVTWVTPAPIVTSPGNVLGLTGSSFSYSITTTYAALSYGASGLPAGLSINTSTGVISGTPTTPGSSSVTLSAINATGTSTATLNLTVVTAASLPDTSTFESADGYATGDIAWQQNWLGTASQAVVSTADAHGGSRSLKLDSGGTAATAAKYFDPTGSPSVAFVDLYVKPVATTSAAGSSLIQTESASVGFQISSGQGEVYAFDGVGANQWVGTGIKFALNGSNQATSWLRITLREDYTHHTWDLYVNGVLADYDLAFSSNSESYLRLLTLKGHVAAATYFDDVVTQSANPLFTDADKDGMDDSWETSNGLSTSTDDRNSDHDGDGLTNIEEYFQGTAANNADVTKPTAASALTVTGTTLTTVSLSWTAGTDSGAGTSGVAGYNIYRDGVKLNSSPVSGTTYTDTGLTSGSSYTYAVRTVDLAGNAALTAPTVTANTVAAGGFEMFTPAP